MYEGYGIIEPVDDMIEHNCKVQSIGKIFSIVSNSFFIIFIITMILTIIRDIKNKKRLDGEKRNFIIDIILVVSCIICFCTAILCFWLANVYECN